MLTIACTVHVTCSMFITITALIFAFISVNQDRKSIAELLEKRHAKFHHGKASFL